MHGGTNYIGRNRDKVLQKGILGVRQMFIKQDPEGSIFRLYVLVRVGRGR